MKPGRRTAAVLAVVAALLVGAGHASAQQRGAIQGRVSAASTGQALAGAQVFVAGTGIGGLTDAEGHYALQNVPAGAATIRVQMLGFATTDREVTVGASQTVTADFQLRETAVELDQVVVTGTAAPTRKREIGNSMEAISAAQIANAPVTNTEQILASRAPGVSVLSNSGQAGAGGTVKIRGINTVSQDMMPLIYVDGVRIFNQPTRAGWGGRTQTTPLQDIKAGDIARVEVVKGAAATTLYGTEAANGVIQIFTKRGISGAPLWDAEVSSGVNTAVHFGWKDDPTDLWNHCANAELNYGLILTGKKAGQKQHFVDPTCPSDGTWDRAGGIQRYSLSVRGGREKLTYYVSGNFSSEAGYLPTQNVKEGGYRGNFTFSPWAPLQISLNTAFQRRHIRWAGDGNNSEGFMLDVGRAWRGYLIGGKGEECAGVPSDVVCVTNKYIFDDQNFTRSDHFISGLSFNYDPTGSLSNRFNIGWDYSTIGAETTLPFGYLDTPLGYYWDEDTKHTKLSLDYAGSLQSKLGISLSSTLSWGGQLFRDRHRWTELDVQDFPGPGRPTWETGEVSYKRDRPFAETNAGFFLQELVGWKDRLFLTAGLRVDGNSSFGENFGLQPYPKASVAYVLSDNSFWPSWWETMKLRAAVGESGKAPGAFDKLRTWSPVASGAGEPGFSPSNVGNADIGPERTREMEAGFDASLFDGRLGVEFTAYRSRTFDALIPVTQPASNGFLADRAENIGEIQNKGIETNLRAELIRTRNIRLEGRANLSLLSNKAIDTGGLDIYTGLNSWVREGYPLGSYFGNRIINPNEIADPVLVEDTLIGPAYPTNMVGFGATLTLFDRLRIDAQADHQGGFFVQNYTGYQNARRGVWYPCYAIQEKMLAGDLSGISALDRGRCSIDDYDIGFWTEKGDFTKLRSLAISYEIPPGLLRWTRSATLTLAGTNLFTWTGYHGSDPEVQDSSDNFDIPGSSGNYGTSGRFGRRDYYMLPPGRQFLVTLRVGF